MTEMSVPAKKFRASLNIVLPDVEADPQVFQANNPSDMAKAYKQQLEENLLDWIEDPFNDDTLVMNIEIEVV